METELDEDALELAERIADFTDRHPEITVAAPDATESHLWEMRVGDGLAQWDNGWRLWLYLQAAYDLQASRDSGPRQRQGDRPRASMGTHITVSAAPN